MPRIEITDHDFSRLQKYAEPFVDTPATALAKALDLLEAKTDSAQKEKKDCPRGQQRAVVYGPGRLPPLTHTKVLSGRLGERAPEKATWDAMVRLALECLHDKLGGVSDVRIRSGANIVEGKKLDEGYKFLADRGFSYQGVSAEDAAKILFRAARELDVELEIDFVWRDKPEAYNPGEAGCIAL